MRAAVRLRVDWVSCDGQGLCAEVLPEAISLDEWGYPLVDRNPLARELEPLAKRAVASCPKLALSLERA